MTPRQRVMAAVGHSQPDKVAIDFGGHRSSGIMAIAYANLKKALGIRSGDIYVYDIVQQLAIVEPAVLDALGVDTVELGRGFLTDPGDWKEWVLPDGTPCKVPAFVNLRKRAGDWYLLSGAGLELGVQKEGCLYFEQVHFPLMDRGIENDTFSDLPEQFANNMWCGVATPGGHLALTDEGLTKLAAGAKALRASTDRAILGLFGGNMFEIPQFLYRIDNYLTYLGLYPEHVERLCEALCQLHMSNLQKWLGAVGPYIDIILFGDDLGGQNGPLLSPAMYRQYCKPYHSRLWRRAKELANVKVQLHCCGGIEPLLEDLIEAGVDMINPVQITCRGMDSRTLKSKYGQRLCLWGGGCDTRSVLPTATPQEVRKHVQEQVSIFNPGGGFVFQQVHNIMANVPAENILAMFQAVRS